MIDDIILKKLPSDPVETSNHQLLSRKYRPKNFSELEGQDVLVKTLSHAILKNKLAPSYLLTGIRGIGKTTTARIIAKTINCENIKEENSTPIACETCSNCTSFNSQSHPDILEIDAASRTGVDDVRVIIDNAEYRPLLGKYKVFIIDEVHMLSKNAFNALLKLLEEPPLHAIFIFATTEVHKIPLTVISRCQRFDLSRFSNESIVKLLTKISKIENINYDDESLKIIASKSDGSARDSLSLLDQARLLASSNDGAITKELVNKMIGAVDRDKLLVFLRAIVSNNNEDALKVLDEVHENHSDFNIFLSELLNLIAYIAKKHVIPTYSKDEFLSHENEIEDLAKKTDTIFSQIAWQLSYKAQQDLRQTIDQLQLMQMLAIKLIYLISSKDDFAGSPRLKSEVIEAKAEKKEHHFEDFLKFLHIKREMDLYYNLLNKLELISQDDNCFIFRFAVQNPKLETEIRQKLKDFADNVSCIFEYDNIIKPYKQHLKEKINLNPTMQKIAKNFSGFEIVDIVMNQGVITGKNEH